MEDLRGFEGFFPLSRSLPRILAALEFSAFRAPQALRGRCRGPLALCLAASRGCRWCFRSTFAGRRSACLPYGALRPMRLSVAAPQGSRAVLPAAGAVSRVFIFPKTVSVLRCEAFRIGEKARHAGRNSGLRPFLAPE